MLGVHPYIAFRGDCRQAIEFYKQALNAEVLFTQTVGESPLSDMGPPENIMHATIKVGDSLIMMSDDARPEAAGSSGNISLTIGIDDPGRAQLLFANLSQDGSVIMPLQRTYWAEAFGILRDRFGIQWMVNCERAR